MGLLSLFVASWTVFKLDSNMVYDRETIRKYLEVNELDPNMVYDRNYGVIWSM